MPSTTGNIAAVETETSSQLNWRLAVKRIARKPEETTRYSDASFVNALGILYVLFGRVLCPLAALGAGLLASEIEVPSLAP